MCGIAGIFNYGSGRPVDRALFSLLTFELCHEQFIPPGPAAVRAPQPIALEEIA